MGGTTRGHQPRWVLSVLLLCVQCWWAAADDDGNCDAEGLNKAEDRCQYVKDNCDGIVNLINYLKIYECSPGGATTQGLLWIVLTVWLCLMISLLATTADFYFVPALEYLSFSMLKLSPEVAGITLLALGNGAPDVFGAMAGINGQDDFQVVLGALLGASIFISSVVLGAVLLVAKNTSVDKPTFQRDVFAYIGTVVIIVAIAHDGHVSIWETIGLLFCYVIYVTVVVARSRKDAKRQISVASGEGGSSNLDASHHSVASVASVSVVSHGHVFVGKLENPEQVPRTGDDLFGAGKSGLRAEGLGEGLLEDDRTPPNQDPQYLQQSHHSNRTLSGVSTTSNAVAGVDLLGNPLDVSEHPAVPTSTGQRHAYHSLSRDRMHSGVSAYSGKSLGASLHGGGLALSGGGLVAPPAPPVPVWWGDSTPLAGLEWPAASGESPGLAASALAAVFRVQAVLELPFTLVRWASCPAVDGTWDAARRIVAVVSPIGFAQVTLLDAYGWDGFALEAAPGFPVWLLLFLITGVIAAGIFVATVPQETSGGGAGGDAGGGAGGGGNGNGGDDERDSSNVSVPYDGLLPDSAGSDPQHTDIDNDDGLNDDYNNNEGLVATQDAESSADITGDGDGDEEGAPLPRIYPLLTLGAFASSVVWMDLIANEAVALMESLGVLLHISTSILGLTVLALGNSVGDLIADLAVAKAGQGRMAISTCFGSPLLNDILGLGIALLITTIGSYPKEFRGDIDTSLYVAWGFLAVSLLSSLGVFHSFDYQPPRAYAYWLFCIYLLFLLASIAIELKLFTN